MRLDDLYVTHFSLDYFKTYSEIGDALLSTFSTTRSANVTRPQSHVGGTGLRRLLRGE